MISLAWITTQQIWPSLEYSPSPPATSETAKFSPASMPRGPNPQPTGFEYICIWKNHALYTCCVQVVPWGFRKLLNWVKNEYGDIPIFITENGYADNGEVDDVDRVEYYRVFFFKNTKKL